MLGLKRAATLLVSVMALPVAAQTTVTLQQGQNNYAGTTDDWIVCCSLADANKGTDNTLGIRGTSDEALIRFAILTSEGGPVPPGATISSATLSLYKYDGPDAVIQAARLTRSWNEMQATWNSSSTGVPWTAPGATSDVAAPDGQGSIGAATGCTAAPFPASCWMNIDVTSGVSKIASGAAANFGWLLTQVSSSAPAQYKNFNSKDNPNFPLLLPKLTITYSTAPVACIPSALPKSGVAVPTFHSMGLYDTLTGSPVYVRYRRGGDDPNLAGSWKMGHALWTDGRGLNAFPTRGSVVQLDAGTQYVFEVGTGPSEAAITWQHAIAGQSGESCPATWSETSTWPVGARLTPFTGTNTTLTTSSYLGARAGNGRNHVLLANQSGTASGYTVYDFTGTSAVAQAPNTSNNFPVVISGSFIMLKGLKTVGGESGIFIDPGSHDIVIDGVEVTGYGRDSGGALGAGLSGNHAADEDAGIKFPDSTYGSILQTKRVVIQHSSIHNPAFGANPWDVAHPAGTTAIMMYPTGGQIVVRYNASYSTTTGTIDGPPDKNHFHEDGLIMGGCNDNSSANCGGAMGLGPDVDIYKNLVMDYYDDGLETDGDGINTRVWKNYFDYGGASAVSTTPTYVGPTYVWRNVYNRARMFIVPGWGAEPDREYMMKSGAVSGLNGGRRYLYHNTSMQPPYTSEAEGTGPRSLGAGFGAGGNGGVNAMQNTISLNNVFEMWRTDADVLDLTDTSNPCDGSATGNCLNHDVTNGRNAFEPNGIGGAILQYQPGNGYSAYWTGRYRLAAGSPGHGQGVGIHNFNNADSGGTPDMGAQQDDGSPDMVFGPSASGN